MALKHSRDKDIRKYLTQLAKQLNKMDLGHHIALNFIRSTLNYILGVGNTENANQFIEQSWRLPQPIRGEFMTIAVQLKALGREEGENNALKRVAANLLKEGVEPKFVAKNTGLSLEVVLEIKRAR